LDAESRLFCPFGKILDILVPDLSPEAVDVKDETPQLLHSPTSVDVLLVGSLPLFQPLKLHKKKEYKILIFSIETPTATTLI